MAVTKQEIIRSEGGLVKITNTGAAKPHALTIDNDLQVILDYSVALKRAYKKRGARKTKTPSSVPLAATRA